MLVLVWLALALALFLEGLLLLEGLLDVEELGGWVALFRVGKLDIGGWELVLRRRGGKGCRSLWPPVSGVQRADILNYRVGEMWRLQLGVWWKATVSYDGGELG